MPKRYLLDKIYTGNKDYTMSADKALIIKALGYDTSEDLTPKINGADLGVINLEVAPVTRKSSRNLGPMPLGPLFYVAPPDKVMRFNATIGGNVRVVGEMLDLGPGETLPPSALARLTVQGTRFKTYKSGTKTFSGAAPWAKGKWWPFLELVPKTRERYLFADYVGFELPDTPTLGNHQVRFTLDGKPLDNILTAMGHLGIDAYCMNHPPDETYCLDPFTLKDFPIEVLGDHVFKVEALNSTDADIETGAYTLYMVCEYEKTG